MNDNNDEIITLKRLTEVIELEGSIADLFISYNVCYSDDNIITTYVYSGQYFYHYDYLTSLWVMIETDFVISHVMDWLTQQYKMVLKREASNYEGCSILKQNIKRVLKFKFIENVVKGMKKNIQDILFFDKLDRMRPNHLPIKGARVINLQTGEMRPRVISDYFSWECPVEPVSKLSEFFTKTISSIMCDDKENLKYFRKMMGYCLTGSKEAQSYFIWYGKGSNGKSLILNLLKGVLGKACDPVAKSVLMECGKKGNNGPEVISLKDLRLGTFSETNAQEALNESMLKMISGGDKVKARGLYKDEISFELFLKLIICTNNKPEFNGGDFGTTRRIKFLPFDAKFTKNPSKVKEYGIIENLEEILLREYLNEFFTFCLWGSMEWYHDKTFQNIPAGIRQQQDSYINEQNTFSSWFDQNIITKENSIIKRPLAYSYYIKYCDDNGMKGLSKKEFFVKLDENCEKAIKSNGDFIHKGFAFKGEEEVNDNPLDN